MMVMMIIVVMVRSAFGRRTVGGVLGEEVLEVLRRDGYMVTFENTAYG